MSPIQKLVLCVSGLKMRGGWFWLPHTPTPHLTPYPTCGCAGQPWPVQLSP